MAKPLFREDLDHVLAHTHNLWPELRGARIFVTGGTGFFGCWMLETLVNANEKLNLNVRATVLTRDASAFAKRVPHLANARGIEFTEGRVNNFPFPQGGFSHVIHAAVDYTDSIGLFASIVDGTRHTLDFALASGARRFLMTSSGAVYGAQPPQMSHIAETYSGAPDQLAPSSAYGEGKRGAEFLCAAYHQAHGIQTTIARGFAFVGPYLRLDGGAAVGNFIGNVLRREPVTIQGDGTAYRSYLYAADLAIWLWTILCRGEACRPYNVGSDSALTIRQLADLVVSVLDPKAEVRVMSKPVPGAPAQRYVPCVDRARNQLGLESWIDLRDGVRRAAAWWALHN